MRKQLYLSAFASLMFFVCNATYGYGFGDNWKFAQCSYKKSGKTVWVPYRHVGVDISAPAGKQVVIWDHITFRVKHKDSNPQWKWAVVAETFDKKATYLFLHLEHIPDFKQGEDLHGQVIGVIGDMGNNSHLHFSYRGKPYHSSLSLKGALPPKECKDGRAGLPDYPEHFRRPNSIVEIR